MISERNPLVLTYLVILLCITLVYIYKLIKIKHPRKEELGITAYFFLTIISDYTGSFIVKENNSWVYNTYMIVSIPIIIFYLNSITPNFTKKLYVLVGVIFTAFAIYNIFILHGFSIFSYQTIIFGDIIITPLLFLFLYYLMQQLDEPLHLNPHFYNVIGFLIFFLGNFAYFMVRLNFQDFSKEYSDNLLMIIRINNVLTYSIFLIGALCLKTSRK
ncbi:hypothetical protein MATR_10340 [Marivirga tractuosa]|uniref:YhhN-like protein n=1 Tax=Marivirga tractuosa (strain ATCC 23168 / DSM 4126 / NBRC 15989 / NCIMB 1408 / VKM B-1430 / H-43) TaxID=643867 RepID=E4TM61_MARTH|nr:hypothetical protein [Marivirga tractuosa]ADR21337.1 hypothetical protein Ftrac_1347 [Marivirga tractuosa DSM 4126]BDD14209.1 hypothetical protein MATR_10340 [Marivirga tractuosa]